MATASSPSATLKASFFGATTLATLEEKYLKGKNTEIQRKERDVLKIAQILDSLKSNYFYGIK